jgi:hypothetical protein
VPASGNKVSIALRQKEPGGHWEIIDGRRQESVGALSSEMEEHLKAVTTFIQELFAHK